MRRGKGHEPVPMVKPLAYHSPEAVTGVLGGLEDRWSRNALGIQQRLSEAVESADASMAQRWAIAAGIATEKVLLLKGRPTEIVANLHAHRHELSDVMDKLAVAARVVETHRRKGYLPAGDPSPTSTAPVQNALPTPHLLSATTTPLDRPDQVTC